MPQAIPILIAGVEFAAGVITVGELVGAVVAIGLATIFTGQSRLKSAYIDGQRYNITSNVEPLPIVYGFVGKCSGAIAWQFSHSVLAPADHLGSELLTTIICWSEGEIGGVQRLYIDDVESTDDKFQIGDGRYMDPGEMVDVAHYVGTDNQTADTQTITAAANNPAYNGMWTVDHKLLGVAYSRVRLWFQPGVFTGGLPVLTADLAGIVINDWRFPAFPAYTTRNPAVVLYDYLTNTRYGCGIPTTEIDLASFTEAANYCENTVMTAGEIAPFTPVSRARYQLNGVLSPDDSRLDNVKAILAACRGFIVYSGGKYKLKIDKPEVATFDFNETNLTGAWNIQLDGLGQRFNRVTARFINAAKDWQPDLVIADSPEYRVADRDEVLEGEIDLPLVTNRGQALDIARLVLRQSRYSLIVEVTATITGMRAEVGDVVTVTHSVPGWVAKKFRIQSIRIKNNDEVDLTLLEYADAVYDLTHGDDDEAAPGTTLGDPRLVPLVTGLTLTPGVTDTGNGTVGFFIDVAWSASVATSIVGYDLEWGPSAVTPGGAGWSALQIGGADTASFRASGLSSSTSYAVRVRARNSIGAVSDWTAAVVTTDVPGAPSAIVSSAFIRDSQIVTASSWLLQPSSRVVWNATGGPNGKPCIQVLSVDPTLTCSASPYARFGPIEFDAPLAPTDNEFLVWVTVRRDSIATTQARMAVSVAAGSPAGVSSAGGGATVLMDLSTLTVGEWATIGPYTLGPFNNLAMPGQPTPHRAWFSFRVYPTSTDAGSGPCSVSAIDVERVA